MSRRNRDLIVVVASAGGVEALRSFAAGLPRDLRAEARHPGMPEQALRQVEVDHVLLAGDMGKALAKIRVGHAWTADALLEAQGAAWERAVRAALSTLDEKVDVARRMAGYAQRRGVGRLVERSQREADEAAAAAKVFRDYRTAGGPVEAGEETG